MPALGVAQQTGTLLKWLKAEGESVSKGEPLMEIETDKSTVEIEAAASGVLARVAAKAGDEVPVGETIALILAAGETLPAIQDIAPAKSPQRHLPVGAGRTAPRHQHASQQLIRPLRHPWDMDEFSLHRRPNELRKNRESS